MSSQCRWMVGRDNIYQNRQWPRLILRYYVVVLCKLVTPPLGGVLASMMNHLQRMAQGTVAYVAMEIIEEEKSHNIRAEN